MERMIRFNAAFFKRRDLIVFDEMDGEMTEMLHSVGGSSPNGQEASSTESTTSELSDSSAKASLIKTGFVPSSITVRHYRIPTGAAHLPPGSPERQLSKDKQINMLSIWDSAKLSADDFTPEGSETGNEGARGPGGLKDPQEFHELLDQVGIEMDDTKDGYITFILFTAQKSWSS